MIQRFSEAFSLLWNNLGLFSAIILTVWLPANCLLDFFAYTYPEANEFVAMKQTMMIESFFGPIYIGALIFALSKIKKGENVTYKEAITIGFKNWGSLFIARFVVGIITILGLIALIIPGIALAVRYSFVDFAVILENKGTSDALARSTELTNGKRWHILGSAVLFFISFMIFSITIYLPLGFFESLNSLPIEIALDCAIDIFFSIIQIVIFLFYWESINENTRNELETATSLKVT